MSKAREFIRRAFFIFCAHVAHLIHCMGSFLLSRWVLRAAIGRSGCNASARIPPPTRGIIDGSIALEVNVNHMRRRLVRKFGSLIGLLAILMTVLAPAVSQALTSGTGSETVLSAFCSAALESPQTSPTAANKPIGSQHSAAGHWDACGYCNLAAQSPAAPLGASVFPARVTLGSSPDNTVAQTFPPYAPVYAAQPRAPPVFV
jgi:hypothetical protein